MSTSTASPKVTAPPSGPVGVFRAAPDGRCVDAGAGWARLTGRAAGPGQEKVWRLCAGPDDQARLARLWRTAARRRADVHATFRAPTGGPPQRWLGLHAEPVDDNSGRLAGYVGVLLDVTDQVTAERRVSTAHAALRLLSRCNQILVRAHDTDRMLQDMCDALVEGGYRFVWVGFARHDERRTVEPAAWAGSDGDYLAHATITWDEHDASGRGPTGTAIRTGRHQIVTDMAHDPTYAPWRTWAAEHGYRSSIALPLAVDDEVVGTLSIYAGEVAAFTDDVVPLLDEFAADLAFGIVTLRTRSERTDYLERLERSMERTVAAVASLVELRDPYTAGHQRRVAHLAGEIARELGGDSGTVQAVRVAGSLHDIGKIVVPGEILSRPGPLSPAETALVHEHAAAGARVIEGIDLPWPAAAMVAQHHERLDGSGYPAGLAGEEVILGARVLAVADVVEAMSSHRPYRAALGQAAALREIVAGSGRTYAADAVAACLRLFANGYAFPPEDGAAAD